MPDYPLAEDPFPNIQRKCPLTQLRALSLPAFILRLEKKTKSGAFSVFRAIQNFVRDVYTKIQPEVLTGSLHPVEKMGQNLNHKKTS